MAYYTAGLLSIYANQALNLTILLTYLKFSSRLERSTAERAKDQLRQQFDQGNSNSSASVSPNMPGSELERKQAERRLAAYRKMADMEIESILATMMTMCTYDNAA